MVTWPIFQYGPADRTVPVKRRRRKYLVMGVFIFLTIPRRERAMMVYPMKIEGES